MPAKTEALCEGCGVKFEPRGPWHTVCVRCYSWWRHRRAIADAMRRLPEMR